MPSACFKAGSWEGEDEATLSLTFADGSLATGHLSFNMRPEVNERWILGPKGTMRLKDDRNLWVGDEQVVVEEARSYLQGDPGFINQFREFAAAIHEGRTPASFSGGGATGSRSP